MKKSGFLILVSLLLINIFLVNLVYAQVGNLDDLQQGVDKIEDVRDKVPTNQDEAKDVTTNYLKQEWTKIFEKNQFGRFILGIGKIFELLSPTFKLLVGLEYSLSWLFFLSLGLWLSVIFVCYWAIKSVFLPDPFSNLLISAIIATIASQFNIYEKVIILFAPLFTNKWVVIISIIIAVFILYTYYLLMIYLKKYSKIAMKKENEERREEKAKTVEKLHDVELLGRGIK